MKNLSLKIESVHLISADLREIYLFEEGNGKGLVNKIRMCWDFLGGAVVKNPPANAGDTGSSTGPGRSHTPQNN